MGTPAVAAAAWLSKPPSRKINLGIGEWRVFITHVQHYKAEIEPESYSAIVIDLFSMLSSQSLASSSTNESSRKLEESWPYNTVTI